MEENRSFAEFFFWGWNFLCFLNIKSWMELELELERTHSTHLSLIIMDKGRSFQGPFVGEKKKEFLRNRNYHGQQCQIGFREENRFWNEEDFGEVESWIDKSPEETKSKLKRLGSLKEAACDFWNERLRKRLWFNRKSFTKSFSRGSFQLNFKWFFLTWTKQQMLRWSKGKFTCWIGQI